VGGGTLDAGRAHALGIVDTLAEEGSALPEALARAAAYAECAPVAVAMIKTALSRGPLKLDEALDIEIDGQALLTGTQDHQEGKAAFRERRGARFQGS
jgi:2-(1,2-epoxy-1,2-dihydrophenyl)acetyl-CoA isomerase